MRQVHRPKSRLPGHKNPAYRSAHPLRGSDLDKTPLPRGLAGDEPIGVAGDGI
jgi:hypothetical protein